MGLFADYVITREKFNAIEFLEEVEAPLYSNQDTLRYKNALSHIRSYSLESPCSSRIINNIANAALTNSPAPAASPVMDAVELNIVDPETTDERTYRKLSEWYLKQLRECQEEMRKLKACTPPPIEPGEQKTLTLETRTSAYYELKEGLGVDNIHPKNMPGEQKSGIPEEIRQWIESMSESIWQREGAIMEPGELATKVAHALYHKLMEEMPQTENPQASYWFEKARECLVERNDFKAQLMRAEQKIKELQDWHDSHV
jgi:hypothetical protein